MRYTFSGFNFTPTFLDLMLSLGIDRIMFSTDHPYASMADARPFLGKLPVSSIALPKLFTNQFGSAHLLCLEVEVDLAALVELPAAAHPVALKVEGYDSLDVS